MSKPKKPQTTLPNKQPLITFPKELETALGPKPVLPFEDASLYDALQRQIIEAVQPNNAIEFIDVRNCTDLTWSIIRIRRHIWVSLRCKQWEIIAEKLLKEFEEAWVNEQKVGFLIAKEETLKILTEYLLKISLSIEEIEQLAFSELASRIEAFEMLLAQIEARRTLLLREIDRRRDTVARRLREQMPMIEAKLVETPLDNSTVIHKASGFSSEAL